MPVPLLSPRSQELITMTMSETLEKVYTGLGQFAGVNVIFEPNMQGRTDRVQVGAFESRAHVPVTGSAP